MLRIYLLFLIFALISIPALAQEPVAKFVAFKQIEDNHMFAYQCVETGNFVEVEQRYNQFTKSEEVRFLVNNRHGEWITKGISADIYRFLMNKACEESTSKAVATLDD